MRSQQRDGEGAQRLSVQPRVEAEERYERIVGDDKSSNRGLHGLRGQGFINGVQLTDP